MVVVVVGSSGEAGGAPLFPSPNPIYFLKAEVGVTEVKICRRRKRHSPKSFLHLANISGAQALWSGHG